MNAKTIALYLSLGLTSSLLIGVGVNAKPLNSIPPMLLDDDATVIKWVGQESEGTENAEAESTEAENAETENTEAKSAETEIADPEAPLQVNPFDILGDLTALKEKGQRLLKGEFPNVHDLDDDDYEDDCEDDDYEDDDDDDDEDDYEDDDLDDDDDDLEDDEDDDDDDDYCDDEGVEDKGAQTRKKIAIA